MPRPKEIDGRRLQILVELECADEDTACLLAAADHVRQATAVGDDIHLRGLIEFSNYCRADCLYCGLRRATLRVRRFR